MQKPVKTLEKVLMDACINFSMLQILIRTCKAEQVSINGGDNEIFTGIIYKNVFAFSIEIHISLFSIQI